MVFFFAKCVPTKGVTKKIYIFWQFLISNFKQICKKKMKYYIKLGYFRE